MRTLIKNKRENVYNAPIIPWNNDTYTPISNKFIMDMIGEKLSNLGLKVKNEEYRTACNNQGLVKGVIGTYDITTDNEEFGQRVIFRNSYDKSMSFAFVCGSLAWVCSNGMIKGDYQYKRVHRGVLTDESSTTIENVVENINGGFDVLQTAFEKIVTQMIEMKHLEVSPSEAYNVLGELFFKKEVITISQMSVVKTELKSSKNFRHLGDKDFSAFDLYNSVTESLKTSHPLNYISDHITLHSLFEKKFGLE